MDYHQFILRHDVPRETYDRLTLFHDLLLKWQKKINLISPNTIQDIWDRHIFDSIQFLPYIANKHSFIVDIGSGGGLPGIVLGIMGCHNLHLIESDSRKCIFLKEVAREVQLPITIHNQRIENTELSGADIITARACASLHQLFALTNGLREKNTTCLFAKGKNYGKEIEEARLHWDFRSEIHPSITQEDAALLSISDINRKDMLCQE